MFEPLIFNETRQKPTQDKKSYEPYPVKEIAIVSTNTLVLTCLNEDAANASARLLNAMLGARHFSRIEEFEFKREVIVNGKQITLEGDLRGLIGVVAQVSCISEELGETIYKDKKFSQLSPEKPAIEYGEDEFIGFSPEPVRRQNKSPEPLEAYGEKVAEFIKSQPALWEELSTSPEKRTKFLAAVEKALDATPRRENRSPSITAK